MNKLTATIAAAASILALAGCTNHEVRQATAVQHHLTISQAQYENSGFVDDGTVKTATLIMTTNNDDANSAHSDMPNTLVDSHGHTNGWVTFCQTVFGGEAVLDHGVAQCDVTL
jgi:uncharacterized lipoprotein NlpE involved in copper resistance